MKILPNIFQFIVLFLSFIIYNVYAEITIEYTDRGVLRKDGKCDITFVNFGIEKIISSKSVDIEEKNDKIFSIKIAGLINGNLHLNYEDPEFTLDDFKKYIKVTQGDETINDIEISNINDSKGIFDLKINNLSTCDGLIIKQIFKDELLVIENRIYYQSIYPNVIKNLSGSYGPERSYSIPNIHWKINEGLDDLRKSCGIYIQYDSINTSNKIHWQYFLSAVKSSNINNKDCTIPEFSKIVKRHITDFDNVIDLVGETFAIYVLKREGRITAQTNGVILENNYLVEIDQNNFSNRNKIILGAVRTSSPISFIEFATELIKKLDIKLDNDEEIEWTISEKAATGKKKNQEIKLNVLAGAFPGNIDDNINYSEYKSNNPFYVSRVSLTITCKKGYYLGEDYNCLPCNDDCSECKEKGICKYCKVSNMIVSSENKCICKDGYYLGDNNVCTNAVTLRYTDEGVLRRNGQCEITFVNFGIDNDIKNITVTKNVNDDTKLFSVIIKDLINGNIGINKGTNITLSEMSNYIKISQGDKNIIDFEVIPDSETQELNYTTGLFNLNINNLETCEGLIIKQVFKDELVVVTNRLYYKNVIPTKISKSFDKKYFGPSYSYPFKKIHWKMNEGVDDLRKTCGIHMKYSGYVQVDHWQYYLSTESVNSKNCTVIQFAEILKKHYVDYQYTVDLLGENYVGYVFKREGHEDVHMDGSILGINYLIEIYEKSCNIQFTDQSICTIPSVHELTFLEFTKLLIKNCLHIDIAEEENPEWTINKGIASGILKNQVITIKASDKDAKGSLPETIDDLINYDNSYIDYVPVTRLAISFSCTNNSFMNDNCKCQNCPINCATCENSYKCTKCKDEKSSSLVDGICVVNTGYFINTDGTHTICQEDCRTCDINGCTECKDENKELDGHGGCKCKEGYYNGEDNKCAPCNDGCKECDNNKKCLKCRNPSMIANSDNSCSCKEGYYLNDDDVCTNKVTLKYTEEGVLRRDGKCHITFTNFGIEDRIKNRSVTKTIDENTGLFSVIIKDLVNANIGMNKNSNVTLSEMYDYIKIIQNDNIITDFEINPNSETQELNYIKGLFDIKINNLNTCDGLIIKQTFKEELITVTNRLYYYNKIPSQINKKHDLSYFGPSYKYEYERTHWKINEGLDELRKTCGIYIKFDSYVESNSYHWMYYVSTESVNNKNCDSIKFAEILKNNYVDYGYTHSLFGEDYKGYVFKRENHEDVHMDGYISETEYTIEVYENSSKRGVPNHVVCVIPAKEKLSFLEFTEKLLKNCLHIDFKEEEKPEWIINKGIATANVNNQEISITKTDKESKGSLPEKVDGEIVYAEFQDTTPVTRLIFTRICNDGYYINENAQCKECPLNCAICKNGETCIKCKNENSSTLVDGLCIVNPGYFVNTDGIHTICKDECKTCDINGCIECKEKNTELDGKGSCKCVKGYFMDENGKCITCNDGCEECGEHGICTICKNRSMVIKPDNTCGCKEGYYLNDDDVCTNKVTLKYTEEGVLRRDGKCHITFTNFGIEDRIKNRSVTKTIDENTGLFSVIIKDLVNANIGMNKNSNITLSEMYDYIKIIQNDNIITDFEINPNSETQELNYIKGLFDIKINNLNTCDGLIIKQTFKEELITVTNRLYYYNKIPSQINKKHDLSYFGPSYKYEYERTHWKINEGLDELRKTCGIYIKFDSYVESNSYHWMYYVSTESVNNKNCDSIKFAEILKNNYVDYGYTHSLFGEDYKGYVFKRENHEDVHMDGYISETEYTIEVYENNSNKGIPSRVLCVIPAKEKLSFLEFTEKLLKNCLHIDFKEEEKPEWIINKGIATANVNNQEISITKTDKESKGSLPEKVDEEIVYAEFQDTTPVARLIITRTCDGGYYLNKDGICQVCPLNCAACKDGKTCIKCKNENSSTLVDGICIVNPGYFVDTDGIHTICKDECKTCDINGCTECKDKLMDLDGKGNCKCIKGYYMSENVSCIPCNDDCEECGEQGICSKCKNGDMIVNSENVCRCKDGYYLNDDGKCTNIVTLKYTEEGVLRRDGKCHITFVNFGVEKNISSRTVVLTKDGNTGIFNVTITGLINGNMGLNYNTNFELKDLYEYIKITQSDNIISDIDFLNMDMSKGTFDLKINNLSTCDGLIIKQMFKDNLLVIENRILYDSIIPEIINQSFDIDRFGPDRKYPIPNIHWKINDGLDELRQSCGIYIKYIGTDSNNNNHWKYYLSIENINNKKCAVSEYSDIVKNNFIDFENIIDLVGKNYIIFVLKREGRKEAQINGILNDIKYTIEINQKSCTKKDALNLGSIKSNEPVSFTEFTNKLINEYFNIELEDNDKVEWTISSNKKTANGKMKNQTLKIESLKGSFPDNINGVINYEKPKGDKPIDVSRFVISFVCDSATYIDENCICHACSPDCKTCSDSDTCIQCTSEKNCELVLGQCVCDASYYINDGKVVICDKDCESCNESGCTSCKNKLKEVNDNGECKCIKGYYMDENKGCLPCNDDCEECGEKGICKKCKNSSMVVSSENVCKCDEGYYLNDEGICINTVTLKYTNEGVLRRDGKCHITFSNFGIEENISSISVDIIKDKTSDLFNIEVSGLINGNIGLNYDTSFNTDDLNKYIKISQDGISISDFEITLMKDFSEGTFDLRINKLSTCDGLIIKQKFKDELLVTKNNIYYENIIPEVINNQFDPEKFGPDNNYPIKLTHWKINEGLDELKKICGIYIEYKEISNSNNNHWEYYLSINNINSKNCTVLQFSDIIKNNYNDLNNIIDVVGEKYVPYILKRDGQKEASTDGVITDANYIIEINQKSCSKKENTNLGSIRSLEPISFNEFTQMLIKNHLNIKLNDNEKIEWTISSDKKIASGKMINQIIKIESLKGTFPESIDGNINFIVYEGVNSISLSRFVISFECLKETYIDDNCVCHACPLNCKSCTDDTNCTMCTSEESCTLVKGQCVCNASYFINEDGKVVICNEDCESCNENGCTSCKNKLKEVNDNGECKCIKGYYMDENKECLPCNDDCEECGEKGICKKCKNSSMVVSSENVCKCDEGYYLNDEGICINTVTLKYTNEGVLRRDGKCHITFSNFGIEKDISSRSVEIKKDENDETFSVKITGLINGNMGLNYDTIFEVEDFNQYIKISKYEELVTNFEVLNVDNSDGTFDLQINNLTSCDGLIIKQTFKDNLLVIENRILYDNIMPEKINQSFDIDRFGPDRKYPIPNIHWNINNGLDELRQSCGIYIDYDKPDSNNNNHWKYYLSIENINKNKCTVSEYSDIIKNNFIDFENITDLVGKNYIIFVLKREGRKEAQINGILNDIKYTIEINQKSCTNRVALNLGSIKSNEPVSFTEFTNKLINEYFNIELEDNDKVEWTISSNKKTANGKMKNQTLKIESLKGSFPDNINGVINYEKPKGDKPIDVSRFVISFVCDKATYTDEKCRCRACSFNCESCTDSKTCTKCNDEENCALVLGMCICNASYFITIDNNVIICNEDCGECNKDGCISCRDELKEVNDNGDCTCIKGYYMGENNKCLPCNDDCEECGEKGICLKCKNPGMIVNADNNTCQCKNGYYLNDNEECTNKVTLRYTDEGVLRRNGKCEITFDNFGIEESISSISVKLIEDESGLYNVIINDLINGNIGLNYDTIFELNDLNKYIKVTQNGKILENIEVSNINDSDGTFDLKINHIATCDGLIIKQTFKDELLVVDNRIYYENVIPKIINQSFDLDKFGPDKNYSYEMINWRINEGLDELKKTCGIYIFYKQISVHNNKHWEYYLSTENINSKKCSVFEYSKIIKRNFIDYEKIINIVGDNYIPFVIKREGHNVAKMNGIMENEKYAIEINQKSCKSQFTALNLGSIISQKPFSFKTFTENLISEKLGMTLNDDEKIEWSISNDKKIANGKIKNQVLKIESLIGTFPESIEDDIMYNLVSGENSISLARFALTFVCGSGMYPDENCRCKECSLNCITCIDNKTCTKCNDEDNCALVQGMCICNASYFVDTDGSVTICNKECETCNTFGCTSCKKQYKEVDDKGNCICQKGYYMDKNECLPCNSDCEECGEKGICKKCKNSSMVVSSDNVCKCDEGYYLNDENVCINTVTLKYTDDGVLRRDGKCHITFVNFGVENNISSKSVDIVNKNDETFSVIITGLINGNMGLNYDTKFELEDIKKYIKIIQDNKEISDIEVSNMNLPKGTFDLKINNISTCDGLIVKQTFKDNLLVIENRILYENDIPEKINQSFDSDKFGPDKKYPIPNIHWKINEGLDELRKTCGIYIKYYIDKPNTSNNIHWEYYLSIENINTKKCTVFEYSKIVKNNFNDYEKISDIVGDNYIIYVLKREGHKEAQINGIIKDINYILEINQKSCTEKDALNIGSIKSNEPILFTEFTNKLVNEYFNIELEGNEKIEWTISSDKKTANGKMISQIIKVESLKGTFPEYIDGTINYETNEGINSISVSRFVVTFACSEKTYIDDNCICHKCSQDCISCTNGSTCTQCTNDKKCELVLGQCVCDASYYINNGKVVICDKDCDTCDASGCTSCKNKFKEADNGQCKCIKGYYMDENKECLPCNDDCEECGEKGICKKCKNSSMVVSSENVCKCDEGYYLNDEGICINTITIKYTESGVLRRDGVCHITYINFGTEEHLKMQTITKNIDKSTGTFNVIITSLVNGNIGINKGTTVTVEELYDLIKITQNGHIISNYEIINADFKNGYFDLKLNYITTCEGLIIKQTFKESLLEVANRLYYYNAIPPIINKNFPQNHFGPSYDYPFKRIHWKINEGLDDLRKSCGIHLVYSGNRIVTSNTNHWQYYLSIESVNSKSCTVLEFFEVIKRNYIDYQYTIDLLGEGYVGYVLKREGHVEAHMDGVNLGVKHSIEIYQKSCNKQFENQIICTIRTDNELSFMEFTNKFIKLCMNVTLVEEHIPAWSINDGVATGLFDNEIVEISMIENEKDARGSLPDSTDKNIIYKSFNDAKISKVARFVVNYVCKERTYINDKCRCEACPINCEICTDKKTCTKCVNEDSSTLLDGLCIVNPGYFADANGVHAICPKDCKTCDINGCNECKDELKELDGKGGCKCIKGYYLGYDNKCIPCNDDCEECGINGICTKCKNKKMIANLNNVCECPNGSYLNEDNECTNTVSIKYTDEGVLRRDGLCHITFVNFGTEGHILNRVITKNKHEDSGIFDVTIGSLINGNIGINYNTNITVEELHDYIKIIQNNIEITDYEILNADYDKGLFDLKINHLFTCEGLIVKQTFKEDLLSVANRLYYYNVIPPVINKAFPSEHFGPSYSYPFKRIHWKINEGLDDLRTSCGIYIVFSEDTLFHHVENTNHWQYYLSIESINTKGCTILEFFEVIKRHYIDYQYTIDLLGESYIGYVLKREGHVEAHMDGVNLGVKYSIEMYQKSCNKQINDQSICTIKSDEELSFIEFTNRLMTECLHNNIEEGQEPKWKIENDIATGIFKNQILKISTVDIKKDRKGSLPDDVDGNIIYNTFNKEHYTDVARFVISSSCSDGSFMNDNCVCKYCPINCKVCKDSFTCLECNDKESSTLIDGLCICNPGYFQNSDGIHTICDEDCKTCDINGCLTCKDNLKEIDGHGGCKCIKGYYMDENKECQKCNDDCSDCESATVCHECKKPNMILNKDKVCECDEGYYRNDDGYCTQCDAECKTCNASGCLSCAKDHKILNNEGGCICSPGFYTDVDNNCAECTEPCATCTIDKCLTCTDPNKKPNLSGSCVCIPGYYDDGNNGCGKCNNDCKLCTASACIECEGQNMVDNGHNKCVCKNGYFLNDKGKCEICDEECTTCTKKESCTKCAKSFKSLDDNGNCNCIDGYYLKKNDKSCGKCAPGCATCEDGERCKTCENDNKLPNDEGKCVCKNGFYDNGDNTCVKCNDDCELCTKSKCTKCKIENMEANINNVCVCKKKYYNNGKDECIACKEECSSCDKDGCLTCEDEKRTPDSNKKCICKDGYYMDDDGECQGCSEDCAICTDTGCEVCKNELKLPDDQGICKCIDGYYNDGKGNCISCPTGCKTCDANGCLTCKNMFKEVVLENGKNVCKCISTYYEDGNDGCNKCNKECIECDINGCLSCSDTKKQLNKRICECIKGYYNDGKGNCIECSNGCTECDIDSCKSCSDQNKLPDGKVCKCREGFYTNKSGGCVKCEPGCDACEEKKCNKCHDPNKKSGENGKCICKEGFYDDGHDNCIPCNDDCLECTMSACTKCKGEFKLADENNKCKCIAGYFENSDGNCIKCNSECTTCISENVCTGCAKENKTLDSKGQCNCNTGFYLNEEDKSCVQCKNGCATCTKDECLTCVGEHKEPDENNICKCINGYFENSQGKCDKCNPECSTCSAFEKCLTCKKNNKLVVNGQCICEDGFYTDENNDCIPCDGKCKTCINSTTCESCVDTKKKPNHEGICNCINHHYMSTDGSCIECEDDCVECNANGCSLCVDGRKAPVNGKCQCKPKFFDDGKGNCEECLDECATCANATTCSTCEDDNKKVDESGLCVCKDGFYDDGKGNCIECGEECTTCDKNGCLTCSDEKKIPDDKQKCICRDGFFTEKDGQCTGCSTECATCSKKEGCLTCKDDNREPNNNGLCTCKAGMYENEDLECDFCDDSCSTCDNGTTCITCKDENKLPNENGTCECIPGYFDDGSEYCEECDDECSTCTSDGCETCSVANKMPDDDGHCVCKEGYFEEDGICVKCDPDCKSCKNKDTCKECLSQDKKLNDDGKCECKDHFYTTILGGCIECDDDCAKCDSSGCKECIGDHREVDGKGGCKCEDGYYYDEINKECKKCDDECATCKGGNDICLSCSKSHKFVDNNGRCQCESHYYEDGGECTECDGLCATCDEDGCLTCFDDKRAVIDHKCQCMTGYYEKDGECILCDEGCSKCTAEGCIKCTSEVRIPNDDGICVCKSSHYEDIINHSCEPCSIECATCSNQNTCTSCKDKNAIISDGICICKNSVINNEGMCQVCDDSCAECDEKGCTICADESKIPDEEGKC